MYIGDFSSGGDTVCCGYIFHTILFLLSLTSCSYITTIPIFRRCRRRIFCQKHQLDDLDTLTTLSIHEAEETRASFAYAAEREEKVKDLVKDQKDITYKSKEELASD